MKKVMFVMGMMLFSIAGWAEQDFHIGVGTFQLDSNLCSGCDGDGWMVEIGQRIDSRFTAQGKYGRADLDNGDDYMEAYFGTDVSLWTGSRWVDPYAKLGFTWAKFDTPLYEGLNEHGLPIYGNSHRDINLSYGLGARVYLMQNWFARLEAVRSRFEGDDVTTAALSFGLMF